MARGSRTIALGGTQRAALGAEQRGRAVRQRGEVQQRHKTRGWDRRLETWMTMAVTPGGERVGV